jgi:hypothetical protein
VRVALPEEYPPAGRKIYASRDIHAEQTRAERFALVSVF